MYYDLDNFKHFCISRVNSSAFNFVGVVCKPRNIVSVYLDVHSSYEVISALIHPCYNRDPHSITVFVIYSYFDAI